MSLLKYIIVFFSFFTVVELLSCNSCVTKKYGDITDADYKHESDTIDGQQVYYKSVTVANIPQNFINLNHDQVQFIERSLIYADTLINFIFPDKNIQNFTTETLDDLIDIWNTDSMKFKCNRERFVNSIGVAFGQYLVKNYEMKWKIVVDEYGTDYSTILPELKISNFPISSVGKAIDQKRVGSLSAISMITKRDIFKLRKGKR
jgi:hypothetical protein